MGMAERGGKLGCTRGVEVRGEGMGESGREGSDAPTAIKCLHAKPFFLQAQCFKSITSSLCSSSSFLSSSRPFECPSPPPPAARLPPLPLPPHPPPPPHLLPSSVPTPSPIKKKPQAAPALNKDGRSWRPCHCTSYGARASNGACQWRPGPRGAIWWTCSWGMDR